MTINLSDLASLISSLPKATHPPITPAFITGSAFSVGDQAFPAVVTAGYLNREAGTFEITFEALGYSGPAPISLTIDQEDLAEVKKLLGEERSRLVPADDEGVVPDEDAVAAQLAVAMKTLRIIADMEEVKQEPAESWRQTLFNTIELAEWAVETIEHMEADDGTPSDAS